MQFHNTVTMYDDMKGQVPGLVEKRLSPASFYAAAIYAHKDKGRHTTVPILESELAWIENVRPYYKVYPAILNSMCRLKLDVKYECPDVPENQISVRFAVGQEPSTKNGFKIGSLFMAGLKGSDERKYMAILVNVLNFNENVRFILDPNPDNVKSIEECIEMGELHGEVSPDKKEIQALATRIALTVCMLEHDPDIITPEILSKDEERYQGETDEWKRRAEERARKRGKVGWSIGKEFQKRINSPHYTNPHLRLAHTGPGRSIPKIVEVKGYWTGKDKLTTVPTGYILPNGVEVEHGKIA